MPRFQFSLETVLKHRRNIEEREQAKLGSIHCQLQAATRHMEDLRSLQDATLRELATKKVDRIDAAELGWYYTYLDRLAGEMETAGRTIAGLNRQMDEQRTVLIEASRNKKVLDRLREKKMKQHHAAQDRDEQKAVEEFVVTHFGSKS